MKKLEVANIISAETEVTYWVSPAMFVAKVKGQDVRLVTDYTELNKYIKRPIHPFMGAYDTIRQINPKARYFAMLDAVSGYFQIRISPEASRLTTRRRLYGLRKSRKNSRRARKY